ncbi:MAG: hypothetical protein ACOC4H_01430 [bacterium]
MLAVAVVVVIPVMIFGSNITKDHWSYKDIKSLVDQGIITKPLNRDSLTRREAAEYIQNGVDNVLYAANGSYSGSEADLMEGINKLYNLVKAYMTDLAKTEKKLDDILETIGDLKLKREEIERKQNQLLKAMGLRINGESAAYMTDVLLFGNKYMSQDDPAERYRPITQYIDLKFSLWARKELYAEATFRLENLFGGFWGSQDIYGLRRFFIQGDFPVSFVLGGFQGKLTPFTLWAVDDEHPLEAKMFADRRQMNKDELYLLDNSWPMTGGKLHTIVEIMDAVDVGVQVIGARLQEAGRANYFKFFPGLGYILEPFKHDQYFLGGRINTDLTMTDIVDVGVNFSEIIDAKDTGSIEEPTLHNYIISGDLKAGYDVDEDIKVGVYAEMANSWYSGDKGGSWLAWYYDSDTGEISEWTHQYAVGSALKGGLEANAFGANLNIEYKNVGNSFTAYAAQTRIYDQGNNEYYLTQNSTWNISTAPPSYEIGGKVYPFTKYNPVINPSYKGIASTPGNLLQHTFYENNINPYGDATPNRSGIKLELSGDFMNGMIQPLVCFETAEEVEAFIKDYPRKFTVIQAGAKSEIGDLKLTAGVKMEDTQNDASGNSVIAFSSSVIDLGAEYALLKKKLIVHAGMKVNAFNGVEMMISGTELAPERFDHMITTIGAGVEYKIAVPAVIALGFSNTSISDLRVVEADTQAYYGGLPVGTEIGEWTSFHAQELDVKVSITF